MRSVLSGDAERINVDALVKRSDGVVGGTRLLLASKIFLAIQDALGGVDCSARHRRSAWEYMRNGAMERDLERLGLFVDVASFVDALEDLVYA